MMWTQIFRGKIIVSPKNFMKLKMVTEQKTILIACRNVGFLYAEEVLFLRAFRSQKTHKSRFLKFVSTYEILHAERKKKYEKIEKIICSQKRAKIVR